MTDCRSPRNAALVLREQRAGRERLAFGARRFESGLPLDDLGNPVDGETAYRLCIYDQADRVVGRLVVDRAGQLCGPKDKACWKAVESKGYAYRDKTSSADGVKRLEVIAGAVDKGRVRLKAANVAPGQPASLPTGIATALEGNDRATVQLVAGDAGCVSATLDRVKKAEGSIFKATRP